jgi:tetratricopeptide (TPR) repeat protein
MTYQRVKGVNWLNYSFLPSISQTTPNAIIHKHIQEYMNTLPDGFAEISSNIYKIEESTVQNFSSMINTIETLGNIFDYKICLPIDTVTVTNTNLNSILSYIDELREPQKNPKTAQACEYRSSGINKLSVSLFDKALELFLKSLELDDTDFFVNLQVAKVYLYCNNSEQNLVDLTKAEEYFRNALRYGQAELTSSRLIGKSQEILDIKKMVAEIALHYSMVHLINGNDLYFKEHELLTDPVLTSYMKMLEFANLSDSIYSTLEAKYSKAKANILMGKDKEALDIILNILQKDLKFIYRIRQDKDFADILEFIENSFEKINSQKPENNFIKSFEFIRNGKLDLAKKLIRHLIIEEPDYFDSFSAQCFNPLRKDIDEFRFLSVIYTLNPMPMADLDFK